MLPFPLEFTILTLETLDDTGIHWTTIYSDGKQQRSRTTGKTLLIKEPE